MEITEFSATLYFDSEPRLSGHVLSEAWSRQGYVCETQESDAAFQGFRGGTYVVVEHPVPADLSQHPRSFPAMAEVEVDYGSTYCIDHKAGYADFLRASFQSELTFRIVADPQDRKTAHNEWAATMLGIHQAYPLCAVWLHDLGVLVGRVDLDEYLAYADTLADQPPQFAPMLAVGALVAQDGALTRAWTYGLEHFGHLNLFVEERDLAPLKALQIVFNTGYRVTSGWRLTAGETLETGALHCRAMDGERDGEPALRLQLCGGPDDGGWRTAERSLPGRARSAQ